jgi:flagellar hook protein FlgE
MKEFTMTNAVSSLNAYNQWLDNSAANVANSTTAEPTNRVSTVTSKNDSPSLATNVAQKPVSLEKEMTDQVIIPNAAEASADAIRTEDEMTGTLLNLLA